jgi:hypothetical protein
MCPNAEAVAWHLIMLPAPGSVAGNANPRLHGIVQRHEAIHHPSVRGPLHRHAHADERRARQGVKVFPHPPPTPVAAQEALTTRFVMAALYDVAMTAVRAAYGFIDRLHTADDCDLSLLLCSDLPDQCFQLNALVGRHWRDIRLQPFEPRLVHRPRQWLAGRIQVP